MILAIVVLGNTPDVKALSGLDQIVLAAVLSAIYG
jgi:hypothetical protein